MDQVFRDHLPFMIGGVVFAIVLAIVPRQPKCAVRISRFLVMLALSYPIVISLLYVTRRSLGESYGYLIYAALVAVLLGIVAGAGFVAWLATYVVHLLKLRRQQPTS